jgi:hypothetical protein
MSSIFGKSEALKLLDMSVLHSNRSSSKRITEGTKEDLKERLLNSVKIVAKKKKIIESRKFAGETIRFLFIVYISILKLLRGFYI